MPELTDISYVKQLMNAHDFQTSKALGQNFLINPSVCPKIAELGNAKKGFGILEIGTGIGVLTKELAKRADKVTAIELDEKLFPILNETLSEFDNIKIIHGDAMKYDLNTLIQEEFQGLETAVCANLPYYITSPLIMQLLESKLPIKTITVMVQKEAAQRLCAPVGSREAGAVTIAVAYYGKASKLFDVSRGSFLPAPNVDSAVIQIELYPENPWNVQNEKTFFQMIKIGFSQRRKQLSGVLAKGFNFSKTQMQEIFQKAELSPSVRIEALTMPELVKLSNFIQEDSNGFKN
ncbi:MAG: 16S rRNA (adenine(1518)-N(6)/adenine(1519)-N(6))-dimethyltransferase RsmA [Oscillospiraceae bacterium]|nr:16S rRNA (adenine(1518)-N(6)/adenine(1519)-N(6))-dimethyltransferase RsmA [Oscillospiraceae bacterium]